jgi:hypothetical protein
MKIQVSVVVYKPGIKLLCDVIAHLGLAAAELKRHIDSEVALDIVNNHPSDEAFAQVGAWLDQEPIAETMPIKLIDSPGNIGYGAANNISIFGSEDSDYHLVLNPDVVVQADTLVKAVEFMEANQQVGLLVPKELGFDGELHHLCKLNPTLFDMFLRGFAPKPVKRLFSQRMDRFLMLDRDYDQVISPVYYPAGSFLFFRAECLRKIQGFDEQFFMYLEDADIGRRILQYADVAYVPSVIMRHRWTRGTHNNWRLRWATVVSAFRYWYKWGGIFVATS